MKLYNDKMRFRLWCYLLMIACVLLSSQVWAKDEITGAWRGEIQGHQIELAVLPLKEYPDHWGGFLYLAHNDCLMSATIGNGKFQIGTYEVSPKNAPRRLKNCKKNVRNYYMALFVGEGTYKAGSNDILTMDFNRLELGNYKMKKGSKQKIVLKRSAISKEFLHLTRTHDIGFGTSLSRDIIAIFKGEPPKNQLKKK
jgi:hypothetical protein